jgi:hypothetical protein
VVVPDQEQRQEHLRKTEQTHGKEAMFAYIISYSMKRYVYKKLTTAYIYTGKNNILRVHVTSCASCSG